MELYIKEMESINESFGNDIGGIIWGYCRPRTKAEIEVDIENIRSTHMCPECKEAMDKDNHNDDPFNPIEPDDYACCYNFCWQDYDKDLAYEYAELYQPPPKRRVKRRVKNVVRKRTSFNVI